MAEYIEKEMLLHSLSELGYSCCNYWPGIRDVILTEDSADVAPVVHGRWVPKRKMYRTPTAKNYTCSECGLPISERWHFCQNCGARMDGE